MELTLGNLRKTQQPQRGFCAKLAIAADSVDDGIVVRGQKTGALQAARAPVKDSTSEHMTTGEVTRCR